MLNAVETYLTLRRGTGFAMQNAECRMQFALCMGSR